MTNKESEQMEAENYTLKGFPLTTEEAVELYNLGNANAVLNRYMQLHREDRCRVCNKFIGNHSRKQFMRCVQQSHDF